ncbi:MAG: hypothetical protein M0R77_19040 [Gammaproteobacteria bacterium]|nr:hypothetical protein [Gammaproteobacteria bacterium]
MRFNEFIIESKQIALAKKAFQQLSPEAKKAIEDWESVNWIGGKLEQHFKANDEIAQEIERAFKPVRDSIPGQTLKLYRGIIYDDNFKTWENKYLESWSSDRRVAEHFAGLRSRQNGPSSLHKVISEPEVDTLVKKYEKTGFLKYAGKYYVRNKDLPQYYNIYDKNKQFVTDGDNLKADLMSDQEWAKKSNDSKLAKGEVIEKEIDKNKIVWLTNNLNSKEYLVRK